MFSTRNSGQIREELAQKFHFADGKPPSASYLSKVVHKDNHFDKKPLTPDDYHWYMPWVLEARRVFAAEWALNKPDLRRLIVCDEKLWDTRKGLPRCVLWGALSC